MPTTSAVPAATVEQLIEATREVFTTMVFKELETGAPIEGDALRPRSNVVGTVSFTGSESGVVALYTTYDTAASIAEMLLGAPAGGQDEVADAVGELTNMIAGTFRNRMTKDSAPWAISVPTVTVGSDFYTKYVSDVGRTLCPFRLDDGHEIFVELITMKGSHGRHH